MLNRKTPSSQRGHAIIEVSLMAPWIFFLFMGTLDFGFYGYAAVATENAARAAVERTAIDTSTAGDTNLACTYALGEMQWLINMRNPVVSACAASIDATHPLVVTAAQVNGADGTQASQVSVTYQTIPMFPIPGIAGRYTLTRTAQMRLREQP